MSGQASGKIERSRSDMGHGSIGSFAESLQITRSNPIQISPIYVRTAEVLSGTATLARKLGQYSWKLESSARRFQNTNRIRSRFYIFVGSNKDSDAEPHIRPGPPWLKI